MTKKTKHLNNDRFTFVGDEAVRVPVPEVSSGMRAVHELLTALINEFPDDWPIEDGDIHLPMHVLGQIRSLRLAIIERANCLGWGNFSKLITSSIESSRPWDRRLGGDT